METLKEHLLITIYISILIGWILGYFFVIATHKKRVKKLVRNEFKALRDGYEYKCYIEKDKISFDLSTKRKIHN